MANIPTVAYPFGLGGAAAPQSIGHGPAGPVQTPPGMGSLPSQAAVPMTGQPQLFIPQLPYPSGTRGSRHDSGFRHGSGAMAQPLAVDARTNQSAMDQEDVEDRIKHRFWTIENLLRTNAQGMAALNAEQQQAQTVVTQLVQRVNQIDDFARTIDLRLTTIADGVAGRYEGTMRHISQRLFAMEDWARAARQQPQPAPQPPTQQGPPS